MVDWQQQGSGEGDPAAVTAPSRHSAFAIPPPPHPTVTLSPAASAADRTMSDRVATDAFAATIVAVDSADAPAATASGGSSAREAVHVGLKPRFDDETA